MGVALNGVVAVDLDPKILQSALKDVGGGLAGVAGDDHAAHQQPHAPEGVDETENVYIIGDAQVAPDLVFFNIRGVDGDDDLRRVLKLGEHPDLAVGCEAGQHPGRMVVVEELAAEFKIELPAELGNALPDMEELCLQIFFVVKAYSHRL